MWSQAAGGDFEAFAEVIKEHDLHPDILPSAKHHKTKFNSRSLHVMLLFYFRNESLELIAN